MGILGCDLKPSAVNTSRIAASRNVRSNSFRTGCQVALTGMTASGSIVISTDIVSIFEARILLEGMGRCKDLRQLNKSQRQDIDSRRGYLERTISRLTHLCENSTHAEFTTVLHWNFSPHNAGWRYGEGS